MTIVKRRPGSAPSLAGFMPADLFGRFSMNGKGAPPAQAKKTEKPPSARKQAKKPAPRKPSAKKGGRK